MRLTRGGDTARRLLLTLADQGFSSLSNFAVGLAVARLAGPAEFGAYMLAFTFWLIVIGCHRSLVTEPVIVTSGGREDPATVAHGVGAELLLGVAVSALAVVLGLVAAAFGVGIATPMLAMSPWFAALLVQDYWRAMALNRRRPDLALVNDAAYAAVQVVAAGLFWLLGWLSVTSLITAWGVGAAAGAVLGLVWFPASAGVVSGWRLLRRLWATGRWIVAEFLTGFVADQSYLILVAALLAADAYGGFRAAFNLMGPVIVVSMAGGNLGLPEAARLVAGGDPGALQRFARRVSVLGLACFGAYGAVVLVAGGRVLALVYGQAFGRYGFLGALVALQYAIYALTFGQGIALKAAGRMRRLWRVRALVAVLSLSSVFVLVRLLGTDGAGWGGVATSIFYTAGVQWLYHQELVRGPKERSLAPAAPPPRA